MVLSELHLDMPHRGGGRIGGKWALCVHGKKVCSLSSALEKMGAKPNVLRLKLECRSVN